MSGVRLGTGVLQVRDEMHFPKDEAPDKSALQPIACVRKCLTSAKTHYSNIERDILGMLGEIPPPLLCP